ncbi:MAG: matrixin family metalloprotease [Sandaracinaceae bacterium]|nr:matrixin family metalloprotease [Sandaracinaceae bacterium]
MKRASLLLACLAVVAPASKSFAYDVSSARWASSDIPVQYRINESSIPSSLGAATGRDAVDSGFAAWAAVSCTTFSTTNVGTTAATAGTAGDGQSVILWISGSWPDELGDVGSVIGVTTPVWESRGRTIIDADIQFNNVGFSWTTTGSGGSVDAQSIATHEEGHFLGLDHSSSSAAVMFASYSSGLKRTLTSDDQAGVCAIYPRSGTEPPDVEDPCGAGSGSCGDCTPQAGCGWCNSSSVCVTGTSTGPSTGSCASGWTWLPRDCSAPVGTAGFGGSCADNSDCASSLCLNATGGAVCTNSCTSDCGCPPGYGCVRVTGGFSVCAVGTNECSTDVDAGPSLVDGGPSVGEDAGPSGGEDAGPGENFDAGSSDGDAGTGGEPDSSRRSSGCSTSGAPSSEGAPIAFALAGIALLLLRRRRSA